MTSHLGQLTKVLRPRSRPGFVHRLGEVKLIGLILCVFNVVGKIIFKLQKISIPSVTCVCLVKKHLSKKGAAWQEKKRLNELFESCLFIKAVYLVKLM